MRATCPGPTVARAEFASANAGGGGASEERMAAVNTAPDTITTSPLSRARSSREADRPSRASRAASSRGLERSRLPAASAIAAASSPILTRMATP